MWELAEDMLKKLLEYNVLWRSIEIVNMRIKRWLLCNLFFYSLVKYIPWIQSFHKPISELEIRSHTKGITIRNSDKWVSWLHSLKWARYLQHKTITLLTHHHHYLLFLDPSMILSPELAGDNGALPGRQIGLQMHAFSILISLKKDT